MRNLIANIQNFSEDLSIARAENRNHRTETPKREILRAAGKPTEQGQPAKPVRDVLAESKALADLRQWKIENGF